MPLAKRTDIIDQVVAIALHPVYDCSTAVVSMEIFLNLTLSPEAHTYIVRKEVLENMFEICEQRHKALNEQSSQEDLMVVNVLKYV